MPTKRTAPSKPKLGTKAAPSQQRATETFERILQITAQTLVEVGFERLSTNMVCERAGLTPPALYRYFPNKYALLVELGNRLMERQDALIAKWINPAALTGGVVSLQAALKALIMETHAVTDDTVGGIWIMRAIRAVPLLQEVRLKSHERVTRAQVAMLKEVMPMVPEHELILVCRVVANLIHSSVEMLLEEPGDPEEVSDIVAGMIASHLPRMVTSAMKKQKRSHG